MLSVLRNSNYCKEKAKYQMNLIRSDIKNRANDLAITNLVEDLVLISLLGSTLLLIKRNDIYYIV